MNEANDGVELCVIKNNPALSEEAIQHIVNAAQLAYRLGLIEGYEMAVRSDETNAPEVRDMSEVNPLWFQYVHSCCHVIAVPHDDGIMLRTKVTV